MTKQGFTSINVIIDESPSMTSLREATIEGFNGFLTDQQALPDEAILSLTKFNVKVTPTHDCLKLADVPALNKDTYRPGGGGTALYDAVGQTINMTGAKLAAMNEEDRPSKVIFLIMTDGEENSSREFTLEKVQEMVKHQQEAYSWEFVFLGAGIDAFAGGTSLGIRGANTFSYAADAVSQRSTYDTVSKNLTSYRSNGDQTVDFFSQGNAAVIPAPDATKVTVAVQITPPGVADKVRLPRNTKLTQ